MSGKNIEIYYPEVVKLSSISTVTYAQGRLQRGKWTQLASSLAQGGKNSTLKGGRIPPDIWVILMTVL